MVKINTWIVDTKSNVLSGSNKPLMNNERTQPMQLGLELLHKAKTKYLPTQSR